MPVRTGSPNFKATKAQREDVALCVYLGMTCEQIADLLNIARRTLYTHFADELANGKRLVKVETYRQLRKAAKAGNVSAQKFLAASGNPATGPKPEQPGKKELQVQEAQTGHEGTEWGNLLQ